MGPRGAPHLPQVSGTGDIAPRKSALPSATVDISVKPSTATRSSLMHNNPTDRSEEHTSELQSRFDLVCRLLLEKKKKEQQQLAQPAKILSETSVTRQ